MPRKNKVNSNNMEGFKEGGIFSRIKKSVTKSVKKSFMDPIKKMTKGLLKPIRTIEDFIRWVLCFALYLKLVFAWFSKTFTLLSKYFMATPLCFVFWVIDSLVKFIQYLIIDVMMKLVLIPAVYIGKALKYPFVDDIRIAGKNKKILYEKTSARGVLIYLPFKLYDRCFNIGKIDPFPTYYS